MIALLVGSRELVVRTQFDDLVRVAGDGGGRFGNADKTRSALILCDHHVVDEQRNILERQIAIVAALGQLSADADEFTVLTNLRWILTVITATDDGAREQPDQQRRDPAYNCGMLVPKLLRVDVLGEGVSGDAAQRAVQQI